MANGAARVFYEPKCVYSGMLCVGDPDRDGFGADGLAAHSRIASWNLDLRIAISSLACDRLEISNVELERQARFAGLGRGKHDFANRICKADRDRQSVIMQA